MTPTAELTDWRDDKDTVRSAARVLGIPAQGREQDAVVNEIEDALRDRDDDLTVEDLLVNGRKPTAVARDFILSQLADAEQNPLTGNTAGITRQEIIQHLVNEGLDEDRAPDVVSSLVYRLRRSGVLRSQGRGVYGPGPDFPHEEVD